jgi:hypothetical protein
VVVVYHRSLHHPHHNAHSRYVGHALRIHKHRSTVVLVVSIESSSEI